MPAQHKSTLYKIIETKNPFSNTADKAYSDLLVDKMKECKLWRITAAGSLLFFLISLLLYNSSIRLQQTVPVLINVMPTGETQYLGEVRQGQTNVPEASVVFQIRTFITKLRSISTDYYVVYNNIDDCYSMITNTYEPVMTRNLNADYPFGLVGKIRRSPEIESIIKITSETYQVDWTEVSIESATQRRAVRMRALVSIKILPANADTIKKNPLGIYIDNCEMTEL